MINTTKKTDFNSSKNQDIKGKFVQQHVFLNLNCWMEDHFKVNEDTYFEGFENLYLSDDDILENDSYYTNKMSNEEKEEYIESIKDNGQDQQEIFEYWAVSEYLYEKLREEGCPVAEINNTYVWGRCTTGQAILLDYAISKICQDMEILEGLALEW